MTKIWADSVGNVTDKTDINVIKTDISMEKNIVDIESLKRTIIERNEQNHIEVIAKNIVMVNDISVAKFSDIAKVGMWAVVLCTSGSIEFELDHAKYKAKKGTMIVYQPNQVFGITQQSSDCSGKILFVSDDVVDESLAKITDHINFLLYVKENPCVQLSENQYEMFFKYEQIILLKSADTANLFHREVAKNMLMALFFEVLNIYSQNLMQKHTVRTSRDYIFERFLQHVSKHYMRERAIKFYAIEMGLTPKYLSSICHQVSGRHAGEWIDRFVVAKAKSLLWDSDLTIQQISNELNFANQSFFGKYFKKHVGQSPREFRQSRN